MIIIIIRRIRKKIIIIMMIIIIIRINFFSFLFEWLRPMLIIWCSLLSITFFIVYS